MKTTGTLLCVALSVLVSMVMTFTPHQDTAIQVYIKKVINEYTPHTLPPNGKDPVKVVVGLSPTAVTDVNRNGYVEILAMLNLQWTDPRLGFPNFLKRENITSVRIRPQDIWTPDIQLVNSGNEKLEVLNHGPGALAVVNDNGDVWYIPSVKARATCDVIGQMQQGFLECQMKFMSWTYHGKLLDVRPGSADLSDFKITAPWNITELTASRNSKKYDCCPEEYVDITFNMTIKGRMYYRG